MDLLNRGSFATTRTEKTNPPPSKAHCSQDMTDGRTVNRPPPLLLRTKAPAMGATKGAVWPNASLFLRLPLPSGAASSPIRTFNGSAALPRSSLQSLGSAPRTKRGLPVEIAQAIDGEPTIEGSKVLIALPEHKVRLKGRGRASQNDVLVLLRAGSGYASMAIEGKAGEVFDSTLSKWLEDASKGKTDRLKYLCEMLGIAGEPDPTLRYQLFHRSASALIEAERFGAASAIMMVQSFREDPVSWEDYRKFALFLQCEAIRGGVVCAGACKSRPLYLGWVDCKPATDAEIASVA